MALTVEELNSLPSGVQVEDADGDTWTKNVDGLWDLDTSDEFYHDRTAENIQGFYGPFRGIAAHPSAAVAEPTVAALDDGDRSLLAERRLAQVISLATFLKGMPVGDTALQLIIETAEGKR